ncbi:hypothetical protein BDN71DRAFT_768060 [Pleurotus eryngii]|uniref:CFEM domain-containing protein n=1 Tax=Pleurotus eryngii TaxID=5323 RepID=A0A9P6A0D1_PLEER|nr:hypothetical protein BDN71DRAFT_768060 [Pleurotus eryngii]
MGRAVTQCLQVAVGASNCGSLTDVNCFCNRSNYTSVLVNCISGTCPTELNTAETLAQQFCNLANSSSSLSFPTLTTPTSSSSSSPTSSTITGSSTSSSASATGTAPAITSGAGNFAGSLHQEAKRGSWIASALLSASGLLLGILTVV